MEKKMIRAHALRLSSVCIAVTAALASVAAAAATTTICGFSGGDPVHGKVVYAQTCVACHGANGRGTIPGAPDFKKKGGVLTKPHTALTDHIERGYSSPSSPISMPPKGGNPGLSVQDIKDVHAYMHQAFGCGK
ncbi:cytochrome c [Novosphingobium sp. PP1Y]|uniref:c-type cytochrome n=2 Tax=Novosphingobium TaxID=165696 RepID=UPI00068630B9|nr:cytochrome c [Novosphingobium sp. PP1Y]